MMGISGGMASVGRQAGMLGTAMQTGGLQAGGTPGATAMPGGAQAQPGGAQQQAGGTQQLPAGAQPQEGGAQQQPAGAQPQAGGAQPQSGGAQPQGFQPQAGGAQPQTGGTQPQTGGAQARPGGGATAQSGGRGTGVSQQPSGGSTQTSPQPFFRASVPKGFTMSRGQTMWGTVTGRQGNSFTFQLGKFSLSTRSNLPMSLGQNIQVAFTGLKGGKAGFQLLNSASFSSMSQADLSSALTQMNVPADGRNMTVAQGMVEFGIPLTPQNFADVSRALAQLPRPATMTDMAACSLLKEFKMPMTPSNIMTMSNFIAQNPMLGAQLFELQYCFDKDIKKSKDASKEMLNMVEEAKDSVNGMVVNPKNQNRQKMGKNLKHLARESGIERTEYRGGLRDSEDEWELVMLNRRLDKMVGNKDIVKGAVLRKALEVVQNMRGNLNAQQIINNGKPGSDLAFYYMQIPLKLDNELVTVEARVKYYDEEEGRVVDPADTRIEFDVTTDRLGELHFDMKIKNGMINLDVGSQNEEVPAFMNRFLPALKKNLEKTGYVLRNFTAKALEDFERPPLVKREEFDNLEKVNAQA